MVRLAGAAVALAPMDGVAEVRYPRVDGWRVLRWMGFQSDGS